MKIIYTFLVTIALINISCAHKQFDVHQPAPEQIQSAQTIQQVNLVKQPIDKESSPYLYPDDNGIGPIKDLKLGSVDPKLVSEGKSIFNSKCIACHDLDQKKIGPPLRNIAKANTPSFIMNYLLNTTEMQKKDPIMEKLVKEYKILMPDQQLSKEDALATLDYFRSVEK